MPPVGSVLENWVAWRGGIKAIPPAACARGAKAVGGMERRKVNYINMSVL